MDKRQLLFTGVLRSFAVATLVAIIFSCALVWLSYSIVSEVLAAQARPKALPKLYPNAQDIEEKVVPKDEDESNVSRLSLNISKRVVTFSTSDSVEDVLAYYMDNMTQAGWEYWDRLEENTAGMHKVAVFFGYIPDDGPTYRVNIRTTTLPGGSIGVKLEIFAVGSDWHGDPMTISGL